MCTPKVRGRTWAAMKFLREVRWLLGEGLALLSFLLFVVLGTGSRLCFAFPGNLVSLEVHNLSLVFKGLNELLLNSDHLDGDLA